MKKKIRDLTPEDYGKLCKNMESCKECPIRIFECIEKDLAVFLDKEVELEK